MRSVLGPIFRVRSGLERWSCLAEPRKFSLEPLCPSLPPILHPEEITADFSTPGTPAGGIAFWFLQKPWNGMKEGMGPTQTPPIWGGSPAELAFCQAQESLHKGLRIPARTLSCMTMKPPKTLAWGFIGYT